MVRQLTMIMQQRFFRESQIFKTKTEVRRVYVYHLLNGPSHSLCPPLPPTLTTHTCTKISNQCVFHKTIYCHSFISFVFSKCTNIYSSIEWVLLPFLHFTTRCLPVLPYKEQSCHLNKAPRGEAYLFQHVKRVELRLYVIILSPHLMALFKTQRHHGEG